MRNQIYQSLFTWHQIYYNSFNKYFCACSICKREDGNENFVQKYYHFSLTSIFLLSIFPGSLQQAGFLFYVSDSEVTVPVNRTTFNSVRPVLELVFASLKDMLVKMTIPPQAICRVPCPAVNYVASKYNLEVGLN